MAQCIRCDKILNYSSTVHNLNSHLARRHGAEVKVPSPTNQKTRRKPRDNNSIVWAFFTRLLDRDKVAICNVCEKPCSYKTTITNLKSHFRRVHPNEYNKIISTHQNHDQESDDEEIYLELENEDDDSNQSTTAADVWSFFEQETGGRARCVVCRATLPHRARDLRMHLKDNHPKLAQDFEETSENEDDQNDTYTEVVYLEDESRKSLKREQHTRKRSSYQTPHSKKPKKRKSSFSSDECIRDRSDDSDDQLEKFGTYITCLLKRMPKDVCTKLQMDIINLIMTTKLKLPSETESKMIIDGVPVAIQTVSAVPSGGFIVTVPGDCKSSTTTNQTPHPTTHTELKSDPLVHEARDLPKLVANAVAQDITVHNC
ncbi:uncharacterized protein bdwf isoform X1 [Battus philenor]|uniref:uncharacterized protein bdwf isoform X1 n=1 Tax=Battus philenor TaxID=42288 RepID=UPI0035CF783D